MYILKKKMTQYQKSKLFICMKADWFADEVEGTFLKWEGSLPKMAHAVSVKGN